MALPFQADEEFPEAFCAALTTGERLFLVRAAADIVELLGQEDEEGSALEFPEASQFDFASGVDELPRDLFETASDRFAESDGALDSSNDESLESQLEAVLGALNDAQDLSLPTDPAVRRLLPDASLDPDVASEFRKYTDFDLREQKVRRLLQLSDALTDADPSSDDDEHLEFVVMSENAESTAGALTDIRLVLGERLDLRSDSDAQDLHDDVVMMAKALSLQDGQGIADDELERRYIMGMLFELAGFLQESLTECMLDEFRRKRS